jgi:hypothetical protein
MRPYDGMNEPWTKLALWAQPKEQLIILIQLNECGILRRKLHYECYWKRTCPRYFGCNIGALRCV